jgi:proline iminopeptidase
MYTPKPYNEGFLEEQDGHKVYFAEYGNEAGPIIVNFHGGPGSHIKPQHAGKFDLKKYRVVLFDQRGCGKSEFTDLLKENNTDKLLGDAERLREHIKVDSWYVSGASWGSTLALIYAECYPTVVNGLLISAIFLGDSLSEKWSFSTKEGIGQLYPDVWEERVKLLKEIGVSETNIAKELYQKLIGTDEEIVKKAAAAAGSWESNLLTSTKEVTYVRPEELDEDDIKSAKIFLHYEANDFFLSDNEILKSVDAIKDVPAVIVHGRSDLICPFEQAWRLHKSLKNSTLVTLPQSNHMLTIDGEVARRYAFETLLNKAV